MIVISVSKQSRRYTWRWEKKLIWELCLQMEGAGELKTRFKKKKKAHRPLDVSSSIRSWSYFLVKEFCQHPPAPPPRWNLRRL